MVTRRTTRRKLARTSHSLRSNARPIKIDESIVDVSMSGITNALRELARLDRRRKPGDPGLVAPYSGIFYLPWRLQDVTGRSKGYAVVMVAVPSSNTKLPDGLHAPKDFVDKVSPGLLSENEEGALLLFERFSDDVGSPYAWSRKASPKNISSIRQMLDHELVHATDVINRSKYSGWGETEERLLVYHNEYAELRAYMVNTLSDIRSSFIKRLQEALSKGTPRPRAISEALASSLAKSPTWKGMDKYLTQRSRNILLKGIVTALEDEGIITIE
jgi:hypothetical protein